MSPGETDQKMSNGNRDGFEDDTEDSQGHHKKSSTDIVAYMMKLIFTISDAISPRFLLRPVSLVYR